MKKFVYACLFLLTATAAAQQDVEGSKDHRLLSRLTNYYIDSYSEHDFDAEEFDLPESTIKVEGKTTRIAYRSVQEDKYASTLQIVRNYENAVKKIGGTVLHDDNCCNATLKIAKQGQEIWIAVATYNGGRDYHLWIVEKGELAQEVTANDLLDALNREGHVALYIQFDTGKATIRQESRSTIDQVGDMLRQNPKLALRIEGHTDNVGSDAANKTLSEQRAAAVRQALVTAGIEAARLTSVGFGETKPVAENTTEEGRAKNRRVELVKVK
ncbi:MAG: OmpA family protein [Thermoanaerobaculia bacterium]